MSVYTRQDLSIMQAWPLERKIQVTQAKIIEWYLHYGGKVAISWSAGKDSTVLLDLARRAFPNIPAVFVDTGLEYPEIREFAKSVPNVTWLRPEVPFPKVIERYGYPIISKDVARRVYYARRGSKWAIQHMNGFNTDGTPSWYCQRYMRWRFLLEAPFLIFLMVKNRKALLEQIYDGEFFPSEAVVSGDPDYVTMNQKAGGEIEYIANRLNDEDKVRFDKLVDLLGETEHMNGYANFAYGLRTGILLMVELFVSESRRPFADRK